MSFSKHVILGNGRFPTNAIPLQILHNATTIICCDGAADSLLTLGIIPTIIIGDMDSISPSTKSKFEDKIIVNTSQDTNDQTKAVEWAISQRLQDVVILGSTGLREDHAIGNIALLLDYAKKINVCSVSDYGIFTPIFSSQEFESFVGQQVSFFCITPETIFNSNNLKYPLQDLQLTSWWMGTLNESLSNLFELQFENGKVIVFQAFELKRSN